MTYSFGLTGKDRKALVTAISEILGTEQKYCGPPRYEFTIGDYTVDRDGTLTGPDNISLMAWLADKGFEPETSGEIFEAEAKTEAEPSPEAAAEPEGEAAEAEAQAEPETAEAEAQAEPETDEAEPETQPEPETMTLTIEYPRESMTDEAIVNLRKLVASKEPLIKMALGAEELPILLTDSVIQFPWFHGEISGDAAKDYSQLIVSLCETAKRKKRVTAGVIETDNPRFSLRVFMVSLGMVGPEYDGIRKRMIKSLPGESGWRFGKPKKAEVAPVEEAGAEETLVEPAEAEETPVEAAETEETPVEQPDAEPEVTATAE